MNESLNLYMLQEIKPEIPTRREPSVASKTGMARLPSRYVPGILAVVHKLSLHVYPQAVREEEDDDD